MLIFVHFVGHSQHKRGVTPMSFSALMCKSLRLSNVMIIWFECTKLQSLWSKITLKLRGDSGEVPIFEWSGWQFNSRYDRLKKIKNNKYNKNPTTITTTTSLLSRKPRTHPRKIDNKPYRTPKKYLSKVEPLDYLYIYIYRVGAISNELLTPRLKVWRSH